MGFFEANGHFPREFFVAASTGPYGPLKKSETVVLLRKL